MESNSPLNRLEAFLLLGIGAVLVVILLPAIEQARQAARQSKCKNNLKQVGIALENYHETFNAYPHGCIGNPDLPPSRRWSWYPRFIGYFEQAPPLPIDYSLPSDVAANVPINFYTDDKEGNRQEYRMFAPMGTVCPNGVADKDSLGQPLISYVGMAGVGNDAPLLPVTHPRAGMWGYDRLTTLADVQKTAASTIQMIETAVDRGSWYRGGPATVRPFPNHGGPPIGRNRPFGGMHAGLAMTLFADGSVRPLSGSIDAGVFQSLSTIADDGE